MPTSTIDEGAHGSRRVIPPAATPGSLPVGPSQGRASMVLSAMDANARAMASGSSPDQSGDHSQTDSTRTDHQCDVVRDATIEMSPVVASTIPGIAVTLVPTGNHCSVSGPYSTTSATNSCPIAIGRIRSMPAPAPPNLRDLSNIRSAEVMKRAPEALIAVRRDRPWLHVAATEVVGVIHTSIVLSTAAGRDAVTYTVREPVRQQRP